MPNLTLPVGTDRAPIIDLFVAMTEAEAAPLTGAGLPVPRPVVVPTLLDPGASFSLITRDVADALQLEPSGERDVFGVAGNLTVPGTLCRVRLFFAGVPAVELASAAPVIAVDNMDRLAVRMIPDRDLLSRCVLIYNGPEGRCTFAF
jgi:hypothetical protein